MQAIGPSTGSEYILIPQFEDNGDPYDDGFAFNGMLFTAQLCPMLYDFVDTRRCLDRGLVSPFLYAIAPTTMADEQAPIHVNSTGICRRLRGWSEAALKLRVRYCTKLLPSTMARHEFTLCGSFQLQRQVVSPYARKSRTTTSSYLV